MTETRNPFEAMFSDALRDALAAIALKAMEQAKPPDNRPLAMGIPEAAELLGVSETAMRDMCHRRDFPAVKVNGKFLVSRAGLAEWLETQTRKGA